MALGRFNPFPPSVGLHIENNHFFVDDSIYDQKLPKNKNKKLRPLDDLERYCSLRLLLVSSELMNLILPKQFSQS